MARGCQPADSFFVHSLFLLLLALSLIFLMEDGFIKTGLASRYQLYSFVGDY